MKIGYFGVIIPANYFWQGFHLIDNNRSEAERLLEKIRREMSSLSYMPLSAVIQPAPNVQDRDQDLVGAFCASLVDVALDLTDPRISILAQAVHILTGYTHFYVVGEKEKSGTKSSIVNIPDADDYIMKEIIENHPLVVKAKKELMLKLSKRQQQMH